jgi:hypothetical protein
MLTAISRKIGQPPLWGERGVKMIWGLCLAFFLALFLSWMRGAFKPQIPLFTLNWLLVAAVGYAIIILPAMYFQSGWVFPLSALVGFSFGYLLVDVVGTLVPGVGGTAIDIVVAVGLLFLCFLDLQYGPPSTD